MKKLRLETPADTLNVLLPVLARLHAVASVSATNDSWCTVEGDIQQAEQIIRKIV